MLLLSFCLGQGVCIPVQKSWTENRNVGATQRSRRFEQSWRGQGSAWFGASEPRLCSSSSWSAGAWDILFCQCSTTNTFLSTTSSSCYPWVAQAQHPSGGRWDCKLWEIHGNHPISSTLSSLSSTWTQLVLEEWVVCSTTDLEKIHFLADIPLDLVFSPQVLFCPKWSFRAPIWCSQLQCSICHMPRGCCGISILHWDLTVPKTQVILVVSSYSENTHILLCFQL